MFVFRGERLKEDGYIKEQRIIHNEELEWVANYYMKKLAEARIEEERLVLDKDGRMEAYKIFTKPVQELTDKERKLLISRYKAFNEMFGGKVNQDVFSDEEIEMIRMILKPNGDPLEELRNEMKFYNNQLEEARKAHKNNFTIALNRNSINRENVDSIIQHIEKALEKGMNIRVCIDNVKGRKNNEGVDYVFTKEEMDLLVELDGYLKSKNLIGLSITEFREVNDLDDLSESWTLNQVIDANKKVDDFANYIKEHNLSPFEAMVYIHKAASRFVYNGGNGLQDGRVLPSTLNTGRIVCSGYASFVKAVVDRLEMPGLSCEIKGSYIIDKSGPNGHCHNVVTIDDPKYGINGTYVEDACWDSREKGEQDQRGFAHCLYSVNDLMNFNGNSRYFSLDREDRFSNLILDTKDFEENIQMMHANWFKRIFWHMSRNARFKTSIPELVKKYGDCSEPIPKEKYEQAIRVMYATRYDDPDKIEERVKADMENSRLRAMQIFNERSANSFSKGVSKAERKKAGKKSKGPQTRL